MNHKLSPQAGATPRRRFERYPAYKDSGVEWLGEIPAHWDLAPLFTLVRERNVRNTGDGELNVLSLSYGRIIRRDISDNIGLMPESFETYQIVEPGNVVLRLTDLQNDKRSLRVGFVSERGIITSAYVALIIRPQLVPQYAAALLHAYDVTKVFYSLGGGVRQTMKFADLKWMPLLVPKEREQRAIAAFLDRETARLNALVAKKKRLIELLQEQRTTLITRAVTKGVDLNVRMKNSGVEWLGQIPAHWEVKKWRYCCHVTEGQVAPDDDRYRDRVMIAPNHIESRTGRILFTETASEQSAISGKYLVSPGDIIYSKIRPALNKACIATGNWLCSADMYPVKITAKNLSPNFLLYFILSEPFVRLMVDESMRVAMPKVNRDKLAACPLLIPPQAEQEAIATILDRETARIDNLVAKVREAIDRLMELRNALISAAVTGKIDIGDATG